MKKQHITWVFIFICIDQITKFIVNLSIEIGQEFPLIGDFLYLTDAQNYGTAFQIVEGHMFSVIITTVLSLVLLISFYHHIDEQDHLCIHSILLMLGGLGGNLLDRLCLGYVRDIIGICVFDTHLILNIADVLLWSGLIMMAVIELKRWYQKNANQPKQG